MRPLLRSLVLAAGLVATATARAATPAAEHPAGYGPAGSGVDVWAILGWGDGAGLGADYHTPLVPEGFLRHGSGVRDSLDLELGLDWINYWGYRVNGFDYGWSQFDLHAGLRWDVWLTPRFALYPKVGLGFGAGSYTGSWNSAYGTRRDFGGLYPEIAVGVAWKLRRDLTLRAETGYLGLKIGLGFEF
jgi:hypothetical protein